MERRNNPPQKETRRGEKGKCADGAAASKPHPRYRWCSNALTTSARVSMKRSMHLARHALSPPVSDELGLVMHLAKHLSTIVWISSPSSRSDASSRATRKNWRSKRQRGDVGRGGRTDVSRIARKGQ